MRYRHVFAVDRIGRARAHAPRAPDARRSGGRRGRNRPTHRRCALPDSRAARRRSAARRRDRRPERRDGTAAGSCLAMSLRAQRSNPRLSGLLRRYAPRNDAADAVSCSTLSSPARPRPSPSSRPAVAAAARRVRGAVRVARPLEEPVARAADRLGVRPRPVRGRPQLDRDRLHLPVEHAGVARLGRGRPAVALSRRLSGARDRARLAFRARRPGRAGDRPRRRLGDHRMAARNDVHRLPLEPGRRRARADAADRASRR